MAKGVPPADVDRLPWLEPYREAGATRPAPTAVRKSGAGMLVGGFAALAAALSAGYYIGQREPRPPAPASDIALAPPAPAPAAPPARVVPQPVADVAPTVTAEPAPTVTKVAASKPKKPARRAVQKRKIRNAGIEADRLKAVRAAQERALTPRPVARAWPKMPSPGPAGQVIQLGAFKTPAGANRAYRTRLARYPMLGSMPRVVVPVITKPSGRILYVLRLGTSSRQQSGVVCRNLRASGDHCLVIG